MNSGQQFYYLTSCSTNKAQSHKNSTHFYLKTVLNAIRQENFKNCAHLKSA